MSEHHSIKSVLGKAFLAAVAFIGHTALSCVAVTCVWFAENYVKWLYGGEEPVFFGSVPLKWIVHAADVGVLVTFAVWGIIEANRIMRA